MATRRNSGGYPSDPEVVRRMWKCIHNVTLSRQTLQDQTLQAHVSREAVLRPPRESPAYPP